MSNIKGTVTTLRQFLFNVESEVKTEVNGIKYPIIYFKKDRILSVPDYQREIRWQKETLFSLMNDISRGSKFLGNIILSSFGEKDFEIIDGQQRLVSLNMLITYIKSHYAEQITDIDELVTINVNCFDKFSVFREADYTLRNVDESIREDVKKSDKLGQIKILSELYSSISAEKILDTVAKAESFLENLKKCTINVIVSDDEDMKISTEYYIDVNLKGIKLDTEDIFKGYLFSQDSSKEIRDCWVELKESWMKFNERCNCKPEKSVYSLTKILEHYIYCHVLSKPEYKDVSINEKFTLDSPCEVNGTKYYLGDHVIKVIRNNTYMKEVLVGSKEYIDCLTEIIAADGGAPGCIRDLLKNIENNEVKIICNFIKKTILDKTLIVPKILILKYYLSICDGKAKKATCKNLYAIYFYNVLFMLFGDKKSDAENIKRISRSTEYYPEVVKAIKNFFEDGNISESRQIAIAKWNSNYENEALQYKCKSLATIYNYFTINNNSVEISSSDDVYNFLSDEDVYSIEHFIVNGSGSTTYVDGKDNYELPDSVKKYSAYIFNFIFVPKSINNDIFKNYSVRTKMELLSKSNRTSEIKCEYSKMIIDIVKDMFADEVTITDLNDSEQKELDKYWLVTFKYEYSRFTSRVIDKLLDHFSNTNTDK